MPEPRRAALVTGSTSGIGLAIAQRLARSGYKVTLNYATDDSLAAEALNLCREAGLDTVLVKADISTADGCHPPRWTVTNRAFGVIGDGHLG
jgi:3-oxoacyl-[acyl-carrier protein] reductase